MKPDETVVLVLTGNLLKDPDYTIELHRGDLFGDERDRELKSSRRPPIVLDASLDAVMRTLEEAEQL